MIQRMSCRGTIGDASTTEKAFPVVAIEGNRDDHLPGQASRSPFRSDAGDDEPNRVVENDLSVEEETTPPLPDVDGQDDVGDRFCSDAVVSNDDHWQMSWQRERNRHLTNLDRLYADQVALEEALMVRATF